PQPFLLLSLALVGLFVAPPMGALNSLFEAACIILVFPLMLAAGVGVAQVDGRIGSLCRLMGELSYPVYIIHYPFIYLFAHWNWSTHPDRLHLGIVAAALFVGVNTLAYGLSRWYDRPLRGWLARRYLSTPAARAGSAAPTAAEAA